MYLVVNTEVLFPESNGRKEFKFTTLSSFSVESSWQSLTDTCEIVIAKKLYIDQVKKINEMIKIGDPIILRGGYNKEFNEEFRGFVCDVLDDMPVVLKCEDNMYLLKRTQAPNKHYKNIKLVAFLKEMIPAQFKIDAMDMLVPDYVADNKTVSQVLQELKESGIYSYFVGDTLVSGKIYTDNPHKELVKYEFTQNVIKNDLRKREKEDFPIRVRMTHLKANGKKVIVMVGKGGQIQDLSCGESDKEKMKTIAERELNRLQVEGYTGGLEGFGIPFIKHGYTASITNKENTDKQGDYYADAVTSSLSDTGAYRRRVKLGRNAANQKF